MSTAKPCLVPEYPAAMTSSQCWTSHSSVVGIVRLSFLVSRGMRWCRRRMLQVRAGPRSAFLDIMVDPHVEPVAFAEGPKAEVIVEVHQVVRDLRGNLIADKMVGHIFWVENGLVRRFDIRGT